MAIKDKAYNSARSILAQAGSMTASKSHVKHTRGKGSPDGHGRSLLAEAAEEFRALDEDEDEDDLTEGMTEDHYNAMESASAKLGLDWE